MDMAPRTTKGDATPADAPPAGEADSTPTADSGQPLGGATDDLVQAAFERGERGPVYPVVGTPNTQVGGHDTLPHKEEPATPLYTVGQTGRWKWGVLDADGNQVGDDYDSESGALEARNGLIADATGRRSVIL